MARRSDHSKEELTELVICTTADLIEELQTTRVTARQIAERVGYTPGTLYTHFTNLDEIFLHVNARGLAELRQELVSASTGAETPDAAIHAMGRAYLAFAQRRRYRFQLMFAPRFAETAAPPAYLQTEIDALFALVAGQLTAIAPVDARTLEVGVRGLWGGVHGIASLTLADHLFSFTPNIEDETVDMFVSQFVRNWPAAH